MLAVHLKNVKELSQFSMWIFNEVLIQDDLVIDVRAFEVVEKDLTVKSCHNLLMCDILPPGSCLCKKFTMLITLTVVGDIWMPQQVPYEECRSF